MKRIATFVLTILIGFFGTSLFVDEPEMIIRKSIIFFIGVFVINIYFVADYIKNGE